MMLSALNSFTVVTVPNVTSVPNVTPTRNMPKITKKIARKVWYGILEFNVPLDTV